MPHDETPLGTFFDGLSDEYTEIIERCFPRYREMLWALLDYLPPSHRFERILELGCGTGNLSVLASELFPDATLQLVDLSVESLGVCRARLADPRRHVLEQRDFRDLRYEPESFDLVLSSISVHHLPSADKRRLYRNVYGWLEPGGVFALADQFRGVTDDLYERHIANWKRDSLGVGATEREFAMWLEHQRDHDHHDSLPEQIGWLGEAGFPMVDCPWRYLLWAVVQSRKS